MGARPQATLVDYGMGNLRSLARAFERAGAEVTVTDDLAALERAERLVIPGQGAFGQAMARLAEKRLIEPLRAHLASGRPLFGVCLGLQVLFDGSEEAPGVPGLGAIPGVVELLPLVPGVKRPHMGWAPVAHAGDHPIFAANPSGEAFYFVHSFAARVRAERQDTFAKATAENGVEFIAGVGRGVVAATQFHPEKSQDAGERLLRAWLAL